MRILNLWLKPIKHDFVWSERIKRMILNLNIENEKELVMKP